MRVTAMAFYRRTDRKSYDVTLGNASTGIQSHPLQGNKYNSLHKQNHPEGALVQAALGISIKISCGRFQIFLLPDQP